jgi:hypothetical protein
MKNILIILGLIVSISSFGQLDITKRNVTVTQNFHVRNDTILNASEVRGLTSIIDTVTKVETKYHSAQTFGKKLASNGIIYNDTFQIGGSFKTGITTIKHPANNSDVLYTVHNTNENYTYINSTQHTDTTALIGVSSYLGYAPSAQIGVTVNGNSQVITVDTTGAKTSTEYMSYKNLTGTGYDSHLATLKGVKKWVDYELNGTLTSKGNWSVAGGTLPSTSVLTGDKYTITNGTVFITPDSFYTNDVIIAKVDNAGQTVANWNHIYANAPQSRSINIVPSGSVINPAVVGYTGLTSTSGYFNGSGTFPTGTLRLNYNGYLYATRLFSGALTVSNIPTLTDGITITPTFSNSYGINLSSNAGGFFKATLDGAFGGETTNSKNLIELNRTPDMTSNNGVLNGNFISITDNPTNTSNATILGAVLSATIGTTERISMYPRIANSGTNTAYVWDTHTSLSGTTNLVKWMNAGVARITFDNTGKGIFTDLTTNNAVLDSTVATRGYARNAGLLSGIHKTGYIKYTGRVAQLGAFYSTPTAPTSIDSILNFGGLFQAGEVIGYGYGGYFRSVAGSVLSAVAANNSASPLSLTIPATSSQKFLICSNGSEVASISSVGKGTYNGLVSTASGSTPGLSVTGTYDGVDANVTGSGNYGVAGSSVDWYGGGFMSTNHTGAWIATSKSGHIVDFDKIGTNSGNKAYVDTLGIYHGATPHIALYRNTDLTISATQNVWYKLTGFTSKDADYITLTGDSIQLNKSGHYLITFTASFSGLNNEVWEVAVFKNNALEEPSQLRYTSSGDVGNMSMPVYISSDGDDWVSFRVRNTTDNDDPTFKRISIIVSTIHLNL